MPPNESLPLFILPPKPVPMRRLEITLSVFFIGSLPEMDLVGEVWVITFFPAAPDAAEAIPKVTSTI